MDDFTLEAKEHLENIEEDFLKLESQAADVDKELIDKVFRAIHSIKGGAGFVQLPNISELSHVMETLLEKIRTKEIKPQSDIIDCLLTGCDLLNSMLIDVRKSHDVSIKEVYDRIVAIMEKYSSNTEQPMYPPMPLNTSQERFPFSISESVIQTLSFEYLYILDFELCALQNNEHISPVILVKDLLCMGDIIDSSINLNVSDINNDFNDLIFRCKFLFSTSMDEEMLQSIIDLPKDRMIAIDLSQLINNDASDDEIRIQENEVLPVEIPMMQEYTIPSQPTQALTKTQDNELIRVESTDKSESLPENVQTSSGSRRDSSDSIRINIDLLDKIMNLAGELVLVRNQQLTVVDRSNSKQIDITQRLDLVTSEIQESIMRLRMQPIGNLFSRLPRITRDLSKRFNKSIMIVITGHDVELDKTILESLPNPLMHIIRNCCDHGIETPAERKKNGKSETGYIKVNAYHEAGQIHIIIEDDGKGIDPQRIKQKIIEKKLKSKDDINSMSDKELLSYIMLPGFSTIDHANDISGRGVGMDVVKSTIEQLGGTIDLESRVNEGTMIQIRLPLTLAIIPCLIVQSGNEKYAIPEVNIEELVSLYDDEICSKIENNNDQEVFRLRNLLLPIVRLNEVLRNKKPLSETDRLIITEHYQKLHSARLKEKTIEQELLVFAVIKIGILQFGLIVDKVIGTEEIVVNPIHHKIKPLKIYSGTTIMGDGSVALILDVNGIAGHAGIKFTSEHDQKVPETQQSSNTDNHRVLIFQSGNHERFALPLILLRRVELITLDQIEKVGEREFISIDNNPTLIVRLNNILAVSLCVDQHEMFILLPKQSHHPIGILISNLLDVVNMPLELNKNSYLDEGLLGTTIINGHITLFLDIYQLIDKVEKQYSLNGSSKQKQRNLLTHKKILLIEDTNFFQRLIKGYLDSAGYQVSLADNGLKALEIMEKEPFDLIVSDIEMPEMDGLTFIRRVKTMDQFKHIPMLALSSMDSPEDIEKGIKAGFDAYEIKIDRDKLIEKISVLIQSKYKTTT